MSCILENEHIKVTINSHGAELSSLIHKGTGVEHIWQADPAVWGRHAPHLFPIVGQLADHSYTLGKRIFPLSQHGFARDREFVQEIRTEDKAVFTLRSDEESLAVYPFRFRFSITYSIIVSKLSVGYQVSNEDDKPMWFSIGAHPGFACPFYEGERFEDYYLEFQHRETTSRMLFADGLLTGEKVLYLEKINTIALASTTFDQDAIILHALNSKYVDLKTRKHKRFLRFDFTGFPLLAFWSKPKANAPYICIEPWYGVADTHGESKDFTQKAYIQSLEIGRQFHAKYSMELCER